MAKKRDQKNVNERFSPNSAEHYEHHCSPGGAWPLRDKVAVILALVGLTVTGGLGLWVYHILQDEETPIPDVRSSIRLTTAFRKVEKSVEITDPQDIAFLRQLFGQSYIAGYDDPICPFDMVWFTFSYEGRDISFAPAADGCNLVSYGPSIGRLNKIFQISWEEKQRLDKIWKSSRASH